MGKRCLGLGLGLCEVSSLKCMQGWEIKVSCLERCPHREREVPLLFILQGRLAVELEGQLTYPHTFESVTLTAPHECEFCKHRVCIKDGKSCCI